jgi:hypothetical protein
MKTIMQRLGRAARELFENGHFIWLVPSYVFGLPKMSYAPRPEKASRLSNVDAVSIDGKADGDTLKKADAS